MNTLGGRSGGVENMQQLDASLKDAIREPKVLVGVDFGGKSTRAAVFVDGVKKGEHSFPTYKVSEDEPVAQRVEGHVKNINSAIIEAAKAAEVSVSEIDAVVFGAPGSRYKGKYKMPNAIGKDPETKVMAEVDMETPVREKLTLAGLRGDAVVRGYNDVDIVAATTNLGKNPVTINQGLGELNKLEAREESYFIWLGTGIGVGIADRWGVNEGAFGAQEGGHGEVHTDLSAEKFRCGCGKHNSGSVCIEAVASTTGQEKLVRHLVSKSFSGERKMNVQEMKTLLSETQKHNQKKLAEHAADLSAQERTELQRSVSATEELLGRLNGFTPQEGHEEYVKHVVFDSGVADRLANGRPPQVELAAEAMRISGKHLGRFIRNITAMRNPKQIIIGGGGGMTFKYGDKEENPFWKGMLSELGPENDPHQSIKRAWIVAVVDPTVNLGIEGCVNMGRKLFVEGQKKAAD
ncbi:MAG: ROK family protein [Candidatus Altiarchaeota archaeon]